MISTKNAKKLVAFIFNPIKRFIDLQVLELHSRYQMMPFVSFWTRINEQASSISNKRYLKINKTGKIQF